MERERLLQLMNLFYDTHEIPIGVFTGGGDCIASFPPALGGEYPFSTAAALSRDTAEPVAYLPDAQGLSFGKVSSPDMECYVLLGPVAAAPMDEDTLRAVMRNHFIPAGRLDDMQSLFYYMPRITYTRFLSMMALLEYVITGTVLDPGQIPCPAAPGFSLSSLHRDIVDTTYAHNEEQNNNLFRSYQNEQIFFSYVDSGDVEGSLGFLNRPDALLSGVVADNPLRQFKNVVLITVSLLARHAIKEGVNVREAYEMSDGYIQEIERTGHMNQLYMILQDATLHYVQKINDVRVPEGISKMIHQCVQFIGRSVNEAITVNDVAEHAGKSRSFLSVVFKKEMGISIGSYITKCKIDEAKRLLRFTEKSLAEISDYLCFSSQSYFQNVFRNTTGTTPQKYRNSSRA